MEALREPRLAMEFFSNPDSWYSTQPSRSSSITEEAMTSHPSPPTGNVTSTVPEQQGNIASQPSTEQWHAPPQSEMQANAGAPPQSEAPTNSARLRCDADAPRTLSGSSSPPLLQSILPGDLGSWLPKDILALPCELPDPRKEPLLRSYGITELHWAILIGSITAAGDLLNRNAADVHRPTSKYVWRPSASRDSKEIQFVSPLFLAARTGRVALVEMLLEHGAVEDILKPDNTGASALHAAALSGKMTVMSLLLAALALNPRLSNTINHKDYKDRTPLHYAAGRGHEGMVKALLDAGADMYAEDKLLATPFYFAVMFGNNVPCIDRLSSACKMRNVNEAARPKGWTVLHYAARHGQLAFVQWLLHKKADFNVAEPELGNRPLHLAARRPEIIGALTAAGADVWLENKEGEVAIEIAHKCKDVVSVRAHIRAIRKKLPSAEAVDPFAKHGKDGATLLHYVSAYGKAEDLAWIVGLPAFQAETTDETLKEMSKINGRDDRSQSAVHWAAVAGNMEALQMLAENKAELDALDGEGRSVLRLAIAHSTPGSDFVRAFPALPSVNMQIQRRVTHDEAAQWMKEYYAANNELRRALVIKLNKLYQVRILVKHYIIEVMEQLQGRLFLGCKQLNYVQRLNRTASTIASKEAPLQAPQNEPIHHNILDDLPPLYLALYADREDLATFMQEHIKGSAKHDAIVNRQGVETQRTALHWATIMGELAIVVKLCTSPLYSKDLKPNTEDKYGKTPLQYAKEMNQPAIEKQLLERKDVKCHLEALYRDRQVYVDAANAMLVAAALIASVTFAGWLQPPLSYVTYYNMPVPGAPDGTDEAYAAVQQQLGVRAFWGFNNLSFTFAVATVLAGLLGVVPVPSRYIATTVVHLRRTLLLASAMLALSIVFVLAAFAAAGYAVLPPIYKYQAYMLGTFALGGVPCLLLLAWFVGILGIARPRHRTPDNAMASLHAQSLPTQSHPPLLSSSCPWENDSPKLATILPEIFSFLGEP